MNNSTVGSMVGIVGKGRSFLFPLLSSVHCWKRPLTGLTSLLPEQEPGLGFPVTKVATQELSIPSQALLLEAFYLQEAVASPFRPEGRGLLQSDHITPWL